MKTILRTITKAAFLSFLTPILVLAQSPSLPHQFFGSVNFTDGVAPNGLAVEARINGAVVGNSITVNGKYGYNPNLLFALDNQGVNAGKTVEFYVSGIKADETAIFSNGNSTQHNLTVPAPMSASSSTPIPVSAQQSSGGGAIGGSGATNQSFAPTPNSTPTPMPNPSAQKGDANNDGKVDVLDFNSLMVNWGKTGAGNIADFNGDGKVDIFDFNSLMINWTK